MKMREEKEILVFLGPSLSIEEAQSICPKAGILPPVKCGDVVQALRMKPKIIAIIDGFFENVPAVWHKEILFAMEQGVKVFGAASMGALRAAELADFGMIGRGHIFEDYYLGKINDDDEVAVLHRPENSGYESLSDAMVNIRATLQKALEDNIIDATLHALIIKEAKALFYQKRTLDLAIMNTLKKTSQQAMIDDLRDWLSKGNAVNQKKEDAISLLTLLNDLVIEKIEHFSPPVTTNKTIYLRTIALQALCRPLSFDVKWLPKSEKIAQAAKELSDDYPKLEQLAHQLAMVSALELPTKETELTHQNNSITELTMFIDDMEADEKANFLARVKKIETLAYSVPDVALKLSHHFVNLLKINHLYPSVKSTLSHESRKIQDQEIMMIYQKLNPQKAQLVTCLSYLRVIIEDQIQRLGIEPMSHEVQKYANEFRRENGLITQEATQAWLDNNDLTIKDFYQIMCLSAEIHYMVILNNHDGLDIDIDIQVPWLIDALRLTNYYSEIARKGSHLE